MDLWRRALFPQAEGASAERHSRAQQAAADQLHVRLLESQICNHICNHICKHICSHICNHICNHISQVRSLESQIGLLTESLERAESGLGRCQEERAAAERRCAAEAARRDAAARAAWQVCASLEELAQGGSPLEGMTPAGRAAGRPDEAEAAAQEQEREEGEAGAEDDAEVWRRIDRCISRIGKPPIAVGRAVGAEAEEEAGTVPALTAAAPACASEIASPEMKMEEPSWQRSPTLHGGPDTVPADAVVLLEGMPHLPYMAPRLPYMALLEGMPVFSVAGVARAYDCFRVLPEAGRPLNDMIPTGLYRYVGLGTQPLRRGERRAPFAAAPQRALPASSPPSLPRRFSTV